MNKSKYLSMAILMAFSFLFTLSCDDKETTEEIIAEEEALLTDQEKLLLHQTPEFDISQMSAQEILIDSACKANEENVNGWQICRNAAGYVTYVNFRNTAQRQPPSDGYEFIVQFFGEAVANQFRFFDFEHRHPLYESYQQFLGDLVVSEFVFLYNEDGVMKKAYGEYIPTDGFSTEPVISSFIARMVAASYYQTSASSFCEDPQLSIQLLPVKMSHIPHLVYTVRENHGSTYLGEGRTVWVDAHTGRLLLAFIGPM